jgi:hypothetical protein
MPIPQTELNTILIGLTGILLTALIGFTSTMWFRAKDAALRAKREAEALAAEITRRRDEERDAMRAEAADLRLKLEVLTANMMPATLAFQSLLVKGLTHSHAPRTDDLLAKVAPDIISPEEEVELLAALEVLSTKQNPFFPQLEADMAIMLPLVIRRARAEQALGIHAPLMTIRPGNVDVVDRHAQVVSGIEKVSQQIAGHDQWERAAAADAARAWSTNEPKDKDRGREMT